MAFRPQSEVFDFIGRDALLAHVTLKFQVNLKNKQRLGAVFVTDKGSKDEKVWPNHSLGRRRHLS